MGPFESVPNKYLGRNLYKHNATVTLMRTTPNESAELGEMIARKLNAAKGPVTVFMPTKGVSMIDVAGKPFYDPEADAALIGELKTNLRKGIVVKEMDTDINDPKFARAMAQALDKMIGEKSNLSPRPKVAKN